LASIQGDKGNPSARGRGSRTNMAVLIVNPNINQLFNEHDLVTLAFKTLTKITTEHKIFVRIKCGVRKYSGQES
jgi:hypothetical protein